MNRTARKVRTARHLYSLLTATALGLSIVACQTTELPTHTGPATLPELPSSGPAALQSREQPFRPMSMIAGEPLPQGMGMNGPAEVECRAGGLVVTPSVYAATGHGSQLVGIFYHGWTWDGVEWIARGWTEGLLAEVYAPEAPTVSLRQNIAVEPGYHYVYAYYAWLDEAAENVVAANGHFTTIYIQHPNPQNPIGGPLPGPMESESCATYAGELPQAGVGSQDGLQPHGGRHF